MSLIGRDALSFIRFKDLSFTRAEGNSDNISYDQNGSINAKPTISGIEDYRNQSQRLPARYLMQTRHQFAPGQQWGLLYSVTVAMCSPGSAMDKALALSIGVNLKI